VKSRTLSQYAAASLLVSASTLAVAGDCWVETIRNDATGDGGHYQDARFSRLRNQLESAARSLHDDPAINAIGNVRYQTHLYIGAKAHEGGPLSAQASVYLHDKKSWLEGCKLERWADRVHFASLSLHFNSLLALAPASAGSPLSPPFFVQPAQTGQVAEYPIYDDKALVITADGVPPFVAVTLKEYLSWWQETMVDERRAWQAEQEGSAEDREAWQHYLEELQTTDPSQARELEETMQLAQSSYPPEAEAEWQAFQQLYQGLSTDELQRPVFLQSDTTTPYRFEYSLTPSVSTHPLVKINPLLWDQRDRPDAIKVITLEVYINGKASFESPDDRARSVALDWLHNVDPAPYLRLLTP